MATPENDGKHNPAAAEFYRGRINGQALYENNNNVNYNTIRDELRNGDGQAHPGRTNLPAETGKARNKEGKYKDNPKGILFGRRRNWQ